jgi:hypothetical protein
MNKRPVSILTIVFSLSFFALYIGTPAAEGSMPTEGLVGYWAFDEGEGDVAYDSVSDNHGEIYDAEWTTGIVGGALYFYGFDFNEMNYDYVWLPEGIINTGDPFSAFMWLRLDEKWGMTTQTILRKDGPDHRGLLYRITEGDKLASYLSGEETVSTKAVFQDTGEWHHVGLTYNGNIVKLFIDGQEDGTNDVTGESSTSRFKIGAGSLGIGANRYTSWIGIIDEVVMYDRALPPPEVEQLYQVGIPKLVGFEIIGPDEVPDSNSAAYSAIAYYDNGFAPDVTTEAIWSVEPDIFANIDSTGLLTTQQLYTLQETICISAEYTEGPNTVTAVKEVVIFSNCSTEDLVRRDLLGAIRIKEEVLDELDEALAIEKVTEDMLREMQQSRDTSEWSFLQVVKARVRVLWSIIKEKLAERKIEQSKEQLEDSLEILNSEDPQPAPPPNNGRRRRRGWQKHGR